MHINQASATLAAAVVAGVVGLAGYALTQAFNRRERRAQRWAEAFLALRKWQEVPYRILRRSDSNPSTRERLGLLHSKASSAVRFHLALLQLEMPLAAIAYNDMWVQCRQRMYLFRDWAWRRPPIPDDASMGVDPPFLYDYADEVGLATQAVRHELKFIRYPWQARTIKRDLDELRERRRAQPVLTIHDL